MTDKIKGFGKQSKHKKKKTKENKAIIIPDALEEVKGNFSISTNTSAKPSKEEIINKAFMFHSQGKILEAAKYYQYFIDQGFNDPKIFSNYGSILKGLGKIKEAKILYQKAISLNPNHINAHNNLGNLFREIGQFKEAETYTRKAISLKPDLAEAHNNLGIILRDLGRLQEAELSTRKAIDLTPQSADAHLNLGNILRDLGNLQEAELSFLNAIKIKPNYAEAHSNLGNIFKDLGKLQEAKFSFLNAIKIKSDYAEAHSNLGNILRDLKKLQEAELSYRTAIKIKPNYAEAHYNLGNVLNDLGNLQEAELSYRKAIKIKPNYAEVHSNLGNVLRDLEKLQEAELSYRKAIKIKPSYAKAHFNLGNLQVDLGNFRDAINQYEKALKLNNQLSLAKAALIETKSNICDWSNQDILAIWLKNLGIEGSSVSPSGLLYYEDNPLRNLKRSKKYYKEKYDRPTKKIIHTKKNIIHIGYFSADFRNHPVMQLIAPLLELHDKSRFKIYLYSFVKKEDEYTERARNSGCIFRDISKLNNIQAVELARGDNIDIAVDLMGYTKKNRMSIFSYRVAPIQINYLGYPSSIGSNIIDYIIADKIVIPDNYEKFYAEKILRMPNCYICNDDKIKINKELISRKDFNLPEKGFIFTCFNNSIKITPKEFDIWMRLLIKIKGSVLWLKQTNKLATDNLYREVEKRNVDPKRLIFANPVKFNLHLARHSLGDLGLDTFNFNGHKTTFDALSAGLPVLTKIGENFTARVSSSLLNSIGLPELITYNENEYEETALRLANNSDELFKLKSKLSKLMKEPTHFSSKLYTQDLESIYTNLVKE
ncbi:tetratricopeptide repeat protein [Prochlorococcus marinus]|uniref:tetratricopeptide repeat protein n=1 Tax=Prochlorococcus marinus TaxID=1219 RepID=UPI0022B4B119|nr:tetratricopeptide repeat protein [Prochlorococcus marinus]